MIETVGRWLRRFYVPPKCVPPYDSLRYAAEIQRELDTALLRGLSIDAVKEGNNAVAEMFNELLQEASRLVERELKLSESVQQLHSKAAQFGLVAAGIVASLGLWIDLRLVWMPLIAFIAAIANAWWFLCQQEPDWNDVIESWSQNIPKKNWRR